MRKYQLLWETIKKDVTTPVSIEADSKVHARIIKAVKKEKDQDLGWKLLMADRGRKYRLNFTVAGNIITFTLTDSSFISIHSL